MSLSLSLGDTKQVLQDCLDVIKHGTFGIGESHFEKLPFSVGCFIENCSTLRDLPEFLSENTHWEDIHKVTKEKSTKLVKFLCGKNFSPPEEFHDLAKELGASATLLLMHFRFCFALMGNGTRKKWSRFFESELKNMYPPFALLYPFARELFDAHARSHIAFYQIWKCESERPLFSFGTHKLLSDMLDKNTLITFVWVTKKKRWIKVTNALNKSFLLVVARLHSTIDYLQDEQLMKVSFVDSFGWKVVECIPYPELTATIKEMEQFIRMFPCKRKFPFPLIALPSIRGFAPTLPVTAPRASIPSITWDKEECQWIFHLMARDLDVLKKPSGTSTFNVMLQLALNNSFVALEKKSDLDLQGPNRFFLYKKKEIKAPVSILAKLKWFRDGLSSSQKVQKTNENKKRKKPETSSILELEDVEGITWDQLNEFFTTLKVENVFAWIRCILYFDPDPCVINDLKTHLEQIEQWKLLDLWKSVPSDARYFIELAREKWLHIWVPLDLAIPLTLWNRIIEKQSVWCEVTREFLLDQKEGDMLVPVCLVPQSNRVYVTSQSDHIHVIEPDWKNKKWNHVKKVPLLMSSECSKEQVKEYLSELADWVKECEWDELTKKEWVTKYKNGTYRISHDLTHGWKITEFF